MQHDHKPGVTIQMGAQDWQIFQQDEAGKARLELSGCWHAPTGYETHQPSIMVRLVHEASNCAVNGLDWQEAHTQVNQTWSIELNAVPCGGLYRIETAMFLTDRLGARRELRGDMIHHVGVGDVWLIAGQSNATGYGREAINEALQLGVHMYRTNGQWSLATHPLGDTTSTNYPALLGVRNSGHSPWLTFAKSLYAELGFPIGLIPVSKGGSSLSEWYRAENGVLFANMLTMIKDAGSSIRGIVWYQGEADTRNLTAAKTYKARFTSLVADIRSALGISNLPIITAQLNRWDVDHTPDRVMGWEYIRDVQRQVACSIDGVHVVPTADLDVTDRIHNTSFANRTIGERFARLALGAVYHKDECWRYPDCVVARYLNPDQIVLEFAHVYRELSYQGSLNKDTPFAVCDETGTVHVKSMSLTATNFITLTLSRMLQGDACVTGIPGCCPPAFIPYDLHENRPILAFTIPVSYGA
jgi:sialate O-acetylesterase